MGGHSDGTSWARLSFANAIKKRDAEIGRLESVVGQLNRNIETMHAESVLMQQHAAIEAPDIEVDVRRSVRKIRDGLKKVFTYAHRPTSLRAALATRTV